MRRAGALDAASQRYRTAGRSDFAHVRAGSVLNQEARALCLIGAVNRVLDRGGLLAARNEGTAYRDWFSDHIDNTTDVTRFMGKTGPVDQHDLDWPIATLPETLYTAPSSASWRQSSRKG